MLRLKNHNNEVALRILGYEFPQATDDLDANWLNIEFTIRTPDYQWQIFNPCLLTWEAIGLVAWLRKVANCKARRSERFSGLKQDFSIYYIGKLMEQHGLRITLRFGCIPLGMLESKSIAKRLRVAFPRLRVEFTKDGKELNRLADVAEEEIKCFPPRGELGMKWMQLIRMEEKGKT